ncbi:MAG TPA: hypothetical protein VKH20_09275 [Solirubrobacterales bacterium]|nr:hypothetical protein [Solirubrobacterales bacterium]
MTTSDDLRWIGRDDAIPAGVLRDFLLQALRHDAIADVLIERMVSRAEAGRLNARGLSALLPELIDDVLGISTNEDWLAIADTLIEDTREALLEEAET